MVLSENQFCGGKEKNLCEVKLLILKEVNVCTDECSMKERGRESARPRLTGLLCLMIMKQESE